MFVEDPLKARLKTAPTVFVLDMRGCNPRLRCWVGALCKRASLDARLKTAPTEMKMPP